MKKRFDSRTLFLIHIPKILVIFSNFIFLFWLLFLDHTYVQDSYSAFWLTYFSSFFIILFLLIQNSKRKLEFAPHIFGIVFYTITSYLFYKVIKKDLVIENVVYLIFIQTVVARLIKRLLIGGFPLITLALNYVVLFLLFNGFHIFYIPPVYLIFQTIEDVFRINYPNIQKVANKYFIGTIIIFSYMSLAGFRNIYSFSGIIFFIFLFFIFEALTYYKGGLKKSE